MSSKNWYSKGYSGANFSQVRRTKASVGRDVPAPELDRDAVRPGRVEEDVEGHDGEVQGVHVEVLEHPDDPALGLRRLVPLAAELAADGVVPAEGFPGRLVDEKGPRGVGGEVAREAPAADELEPVELGEIVVGVDEVDGDLGRPPAAPANRRSCSR